MSVSYVIYCKLLPYAFQRQAARSLSQASEAGSDVDIQLSLQSSIHSSITQDPSSLADLENSVFTPQVGDMFMISYKDNI